MGSQVKRSGWIGVAVTAVALVSCLAGSRAEAQATIGLYELARFSLNNTSASGSANFIGSNPIAVGWNGSKLYVAGWNGSGVTATTSIIQITNAADVMNGSAAGIVTPTYSPTFGGLSSTTGRGYTGLAMNGNQLAASWDINSAQASSIQMFNASTNSLVWNLAATGTTAAYITGKAGPDFDPGYQGNAAQGSGLAYLNQGSGARGLSNAATGSVIYTNPNVTGFTRGMTMTGPGATTSWRDMAFDPATGDVYTRVNNLVAKAVRTGSNSVSGATSSSLVSLSGTNVQGTNIGFMNSVQASSLNAFSNAYSGDLLIYNNRALTGSQSWSSVIQFATTSGTSVTANWTFLSTPASTTTSIYDFEWDQATQTLAVVDYTNRNVSIFSTAVPEPSTWAMLVIGGGVGGLATLRRRLRRVA